MSAEQAFLFTSDHCEKCISVFRRYNGRIPPQIQAVNIHQRGAVPLMKKYRITKVPSLAVIFSERMEFTVYTKISQIVSILDSAYEAMEGDSRQQPRRPTPQQSTPTSQHPSPGSGDFPSANGPNATGSYCGFDACNVQNDFAADFSKPFSNQNSMAERLLASGEADGPNINQGVMPPPQNFGPPPSVARPPAPERQSNSDKGAVNDLLKDFEARRKTYDEQISAQNEKAYRMGLSLRG